MWAGKIESIHIADGAKRLCSPSIISKRSRVWAWKGIAVPTGKAHSPSPSAISNWR